MRQARYCVLFHKRVYVFTCTAVYVVRMFSEAVRVLIVPIQQVRSSPARCLMARLLWRGATVYRVVAACGGLCMFGNAEMPTLTSGRRERFVEISYSSTFFACWITVYKNLCGAEPLAGSL